MNYIVIDQGTSSTKAFLFDTNGKIIHSNQAKYNLSRPKPFHIECDPQIILDDISRLFYEMRALSKSESVRGVGFAFQRSTFLFWEKLTCKPLTPAISWQDTRAAKTLKNFNRHKQKLWNITGSPLSAKFGGPKFFHTVKNNRTLNDKIKNNEVYFGPLSSFITHAITGSPAVDESIAGRTLLYNSKKGKWSTFATDLFNVPINCLPPITPTKHDYGLMLDSDIPLLTVIGDQQAALIGQSGLKKGSIGTNFGTSASIQYNVGPELIVLPGLISSTLFSYKSERIFMVEGTINACNSIFHYLENILSIPHKDMLWDKRIKNIDTQGIFVPGFSGISAPYWKPGFDDVYVELGSDPNQIIRAGMESIGFLFNDILNCFKSNGMKIPKTLTASGGAGRPVLLQFISSLIDLEICYFDLKDRTAIGVYRILSGNHFKGKSENRNLKSFKPKPLTYKNRKIAKWTETLINLNIKENYSEM